VKLTTTRRSLIQVAHAGALVFGAFWLVATTSEAVTPRDCFTGLGTQGTLQIQLGDITASEPSTPTCGSLDGLVPGATVVLDVSQRPKADTSGGCYDYLTQSVQGPMNVTLGPASPSSIRLADDNLTTAFATFSPSPASSCSGTWTLQLRPATEPMDNQLVSPFDASAAQPWVVVRTIQIPQPESCGAPFTGTQAFQCSETFTVTSIQP
jgi:hypothetical protein